MGAETNDKSQNNPPSALARDIWILNPETQAKLDQESAKNASTGGLSTLDALAKVNKPTAERADDKKTEPATRETPLPENSGSPVAQAETKEVDPEGIQLRRIAQMRGFLSRIEDAIGSIEFGESGRNADIMRREVSLFLGLEMSDNKATTFITNPRDFLNNPNFSTKEGFARFARNIAPTISKVLDDEDISWKSMTNGIGQDLIHEAFRYQIATDKRLGKRD